VSLVKPEKVIGGWNDEEKKPKVRSMLANMKKKIIKPEGRKEIKAVN
jgi:hypothetical protein